MQTIPSISTDYFLNPEFQRDEPYGDQRAAILDAAALAHAEQEITAWPGYQVTPQHALSDLAAALGVASLNYKDEGSRFGLGSFKALGGAYAVGRLLSRVLGEQLGRTLSPSDLLQGDLRDAVRQADHDAHANGWHVISDTSYPGYMDVPRDVMQGYQLMVQEVVQQLDAWPTHVFVQAGVGGFAAAVCAYFWERDAQRRPFFTVVEPTRADCLLQSARNGKITAVTGELDTLMAGLACGEVSLLAWEILARGANAFCTVDDDAAVAVMQLLARPPGQDAAIVAGESAVAGLAAAIGIARDPEARAAFGINAESRILFFGSEADTDPALYQQLVGASAADVIGKATV